MTEDAAPPEVPSYRVLHRLGEGGMGSVFLAVHTRTLVPVALKVPHEQLGASGLARLRREAEVLRRITSPHVPRLRDVLTIEGRPALVMDFVEGTSLAHAIAELREPADRLDLLKRLVPGMVAALGALHQEGVVHRDIKPQNVLMVPDRGAVLVDLGLAWLSEAESLTKTGSTVGTLDYIAPEQLQGAAVDERTDLYQLALVCMDVLCGRDARRWGSALGEATRRITHPVWERSKAPAWLPPPLADWLEEALACAPGDRPPAREHLAVLPKVVRELRAPGASAAGSTGPRPDPAPASPGGSLVVRVLQVTLGMGLGVLGAYLAAPPRPGPTPEAFFEGLLIERRPAELSVRIRAGSGPTGSPADLAVRVGARTLDGTPGNAFSLGLVDEPTSARVIEVLHPELGPSPPTWLPPARPRDWIALRHRRGRTLAALDVPPGETRTAVYTTEDEEHRVTGEDLLLLELGQEGAGTLRLESPGVPAVEVPFDPAELARALLAEIPLPQVDLGAYRERLRSGSHWRRGHLIVLTQEDRDFFVSHGDSVNAIVNLRNLDEGLRQEIYQRIAPYRIVEQALPNVPRGHFHAASASLGPALAFGLSPTVFGGAATRSLILQHEDTWQAEIGLKRSLRLKGGSEANEVTVRLGPVVGAPLALDLALEVHGGEPFSAVECVLPRDRRILFPLGGPEVWLYHRIPPRWWMDAVSEDGFVDLRFRVSRLPGLVHPPSVQFDIVMIRYTRDPKEGTKSR